MPPRLVYWLKTTVLQRHFIIFNYYSCTKAGFNIKNSPLEVAHLNGKILFINNYSGFTCFSIYRNLDENYSYGRIIEAIRNVPHI